MRKRNNYFLSIYASFIWQSVLNASLCKALGRPWGWKGEACSPKWRVEQGVSKRSRWELASWEQREPGCDPSTWYSKPGAPWPEVAIFVPEAFTGWKSSYQPASPSGSVILLPDRLAERLSLLRIHIFRPPSCHSRLGDWQLPWQPAPHWSQPAYN